ncbi:sulfatase-like hydrolase/transferase [Methylobacterium aquaticum]|nr:sulfatase-like hydrolase/transferase [Methylobacterium aquaticum]
MTIPMIIIASLLLSWIHASYTRIDHRQNISQIFGIIAYNISKCVVIFFIITIIFMTLPDYMNVIFGLIVLTSATLVEICNLISLRYFEIPIHKVARHLPFQIRDVRSLRDIANYVRQYLPVGLSLCVALTSLALFSGAFAQLKILYHISSWEISALIILAISPIFSRALRHRSVQSQITENELKFIAMPDILTVQRLKCSVRIDPIAKNPESRSCRNIIVFVNESAGDDIRSPVHPSRSLADAIREVSQRPDSWICPSNIFTNSSCTDVILPTILTGCAPIESFEKLHALPLIFQLAKSNNINTAIFTSTILTWCNFDQFLCSPSIDTIYSADRAGLPIINDFSGDDFIAASEASNYIKQQKGNICIFIYFKSLHTPFQSESSCQIPSSMKARRERAAYITTESHRIVIDALHETGRFDESLIFCLGDHGETLGNDGTNAELAGARAIKFSETILKPLFIIKPPKSITTSMKNNLATNAARLITMYDIAPTIADYLGVGLPKGMQYKGYSMFHPIPIDRISYALNTNEWRSWPQSCVAIARGRDRITIDYQNMDHLCTGRNGVPLDETGEKIKDALLAIAFDEPAVRQSISRIFRAKLNVSLN